MNKKEYQKPTMNVVKIQQAQMLCTSGVDSVNGGDPGIGFGGGSGEVGRARSFGGFDDWDED